MSKCEVCGVPMPEGEEMFKFHGYSGPCPAPPLAKVDSASNDRTANNAVRHQYRALSDEEKAQMVAIKDKGAELLKLINSLRSGPARMETEHGDMVVGAQPFSERHLDIAAERVEEAIMWAVKHITA